MKNERELKREPIEIQTVINGMREKIQSIIDDTAEEMIHGNEISPEMIEDSKLMAFLTEICYNLETAYDIAERKLIPVFIWAHARNCNDPQCGVDAIYRWLRGEDVDFIEEFEYPYTGRRIT